MSPTWAGLSEVSLVYLRIWLCLGSPWAAIGGELPFLDLVLAHLQQTQVPPLQLQTQEVLLSCFISSFWTIEMNAETKQKYINTIQCSFFLCDFLKADGYTVLFEGQIFVCILQNLQLLRSHYGEQLMWNTWGGTGSLPAPKPGVALSSLSPVSK